MGSGPNVTLTKMYMITLVYQGHAILTKSKSEHQFLHGPSTSVGMNS